MVGACKKNHPLLYKKKKKKLCLLLKATLLCAHSSEPHLTHPMWFQTRPGAGIYRWYCLASSSQGTDQGQPEMETDLKKHFSLVKAKASSVGAELTHLREGAKS